MKIDIGLDEAQRQQIAGGLERVLADTYTLYLMTHNFHWNVTGPMFQTLHTLFQTQYNELWLAVDDVAERIRTLGEPAPGTYSKLAALTRIAEPQGVPEAMEMVRTLVRGHETVVKTIREVLPLAQSASDESSISLLTDRLLIHEKTAWMLRSLIG
jgi:starvation-inducible DNA-binding protein